jgi:hypothetical protein
VGAAGSRRLPQKDPGSRNVNGELGVCPYRELDPVLYPPFHSLQDLPDGKVIRELGNQIEGKLAWLPPAVAEADAAD